MRASKSLTHDFYHAADHPFKKLCDALPIMPRLIALELTTALEQRSFSRWYRSMMMESHFHLITTLLLTVAVMALLEAILDHGLDTATRLVWLAALALAVLLAMYSLRRYFFFMMVAEQVANQATCKDCGAYGRLRLIGHVYPSCKVACKRCAFEWTIVEPEQSSA
ncbi:MAG: hypothetical protein EBX70_06500 [Betaproteobacteria bacterium]|nr:hypothetical protein [Betaproteobacteria bacterium]